MIFPDGTAGFGQLHQYDDKKVELYENQVNILKIVRIDNIKMENIDGDKL